MNSIYDNYTDFYTALRVARSALFQLDKPFGNKVKIRQLQFLNHHPWGNGYLVFHQTITSTAEKFVGILEIANIEGEWRIIHSDFSACSASPSPSPLEVVGQSRLNAMSKFGGQSRYVCFFGFVHDAPTAHIALSFREGDQTVVPVINHTFMAVSFIKDIDSYPIKYDGIDDKGNILCSYPE